MDLATLITQQLSDNSKKQDIKDLLPKQQTNRSYPDTQSIPQSQQKLILIPEKFFIGERNKEWVMWYTLQWPGPPMPTQKREASSEQLNAFFKEHIASKSRPGEEKYFILKYIDKNKMQYVFDVEKWMKDNYSSAKQRFSAPMSLIYKGLKDLPLHVFVNSNTIDFNKFLANKFYEFLKNKPSKLKHSEFGFIQKFSAELFNYSFSFRDMTFIATLKFSVILASLAAYMLWKYKKEFSKPELEKLKKKTSNMKDVKNLDKYLKKL